MPRPRDFRRWEWLVLSLTLCLLVFLAIHGKGRRERLAYERFLEVAPQVQAALEAFAKDHQGRFPPDAMMTSRPAGLTDNYIKWRKSWKIDYEVHDNGQDGQCVCLEFCGPFEERLYFGLCKEPEYRRLYGRGQAIPGHVNRIWVIRENAEIMDPPPGPPEPPEGPPPGPPPGHPPGPPPGPPPGYPPGPPPGPPSGPPPGPPPGHPPGPWAPPAPTGR